MHMPLVILGEETANVKACSRASGKASAFAKATHGQLPALLDDLPAGDARDSCLRSKYCCQLAAGCS
jgi:hypothetical protein